MEPCIFTVPWVFFAGFLFSSYCCCSVVVVAAAAVAGPAELVPAFIVFGDSTADVGMNTFYPSLLRSDFTPYGQNFDGGRATGRFTDGRLVTDMLAVRLGLPLNLPYLDPKATGERLLKGVNFASAGSGYLESTSRLLNVIPIFEQLQLFYQYQSKLVNLVGQARTSFIISEAIFVISTGSNDFILSYLLNPHLQQQYTPAQWDSFVLSNQTLFVKRLYEAGARKFVIFGFPPLGCLPAEITLFGREGPSQGRCVEAFNQIGIAHNILLREAIPQWEAALPGLRTLYGDGYTYLYEAFNNPSKYGYTESRRGCCGEGLLATAVFCNAKSPGTCSDPSTYIFFDSVHPTETVYKAVADATWTDMVSFFGLKS